MATLAQDAAHVAHHVEHEIHHCMTDSSEDEYDYDYETDSNYELDAQQQWEESLSQIEGLFSLLLFPLVGKALGRKFSHRIWRHVAEWWYV